MFLSPLFLSLAAADLVVAMFLLFAGGGRDENRPRSIGLRRVAAAAAGTALSFLVKLPILRWLGIDLFGVIHLAYLDLVLLVPVCGTLVLAAGWLPSGSRAYRRVRAPVRILAVAGAGLFAVGFYTSFVEPFRLQLERVTVPVARARQGTSPLHIGVLADIQTDHVTEHERSAVARLLAQNPDIILLPGDLFDGSARAFAGQIDALRQLLAPLSAPGGVYFVLGNCEADLPDVARVFVGTRVRLLVNEVVTVQVKDRRVTIGGLGIWYGTAGYDETVEELESLPGDDDVRLLVGHYPDAVLALRPQTRVDLVVAGHTHGGQIRLPFFGPPVTLTGVPRRVAAGGLHQLDGRRIYVSRGIGWEHGQAPRIRFLCPPEVSLLTLVDE